MEVLGATNKKVKLISSLKRKNVRKKEGKLFLEGERLVCDSARYGAKILYVFCREDYSGDMPKCGEAFCLPAKIFDCVTDTVTPQGICAIAEMPQDIKKPLSDMAVLCDNVRDPGNLGTIIRSAHAFGAGGVFLTDGCADPYSLKCVRASMGSVFAVGIAHIDTQNLQKIKDDGWRLAAGVLSDKTVPLKESELSGKIMITVGSEADGVSREIREMADMALKIPMENAAESFNAAVAASIMMYEYYRQNS